jgi:D-alanine-D-alanine ligase
LGLDDSSIVTAADGRQLLARIAECERIWGRPFFAERFVDGREWNLSLLGNGGQVQVLPPAEIDFSAFPLGKPRIVGRRAKFDADSFEFQHTPRRFDTQPAEAPLLAQLEKLAVECWRLFGLRGYARVDFRVDGRGELWILEVNANPCLAPSSGFAAAIERGGLGYDRGIAHILNHAAIHRADCSSADYVSYSADLR